MAPFAIFQPVPLSPRPLLALAALVCAAGIAALGGMRTAWASDCVAGPSPAGAAGTAALYGELASSVDAEPLSVDITARAIGGACVWVYEVKVLTASGSVAVLDFDLVDLGLKRVEGPASDPDIATLFDRMDGGDGKAKAGDDSRPDVAGGPGGEASGGDDSSGSGGGDSGSDGGDSGGDDGGGDSSGSGSDGDGGSDSDGGGDSDSDGGGDGGDGGGDD